MARYPVWPTVGSQTVRAVAVALFASSKAKSVLALGDYGRRGPCGAMAPRRSETRPWQAAAWPSPSTGHGSCPNTC